MYIKCVLYLWVKIELIMLFNS